MNKELAAEICELLGLNPNKQLKKSIRRLSGITTLSLIEALISSKTIEDAAAYLGYTVNPIKQAIRVTIAPLFQDRSQGFGQGGGLTSWRIVLLELLGLKHCYICDTTKKLDEFGSSFYTISAKQSNCKSCYTLKSKLHKFYIMERTPEWAELGLIAKFYQNCPSGYHVDHIIPLRGKYVSGFHVLSNLQYLPAIENIKKGNRYIIE